MNSTLSMNPSCAVSANITLFHINHRRDVHHCVISIALRNVMKDLAWYSGILLGHGIFNLVQSQLNKNLENDFII